MVAPIVHAFILAIGLILPLGVQICSYYILDGSRGVPKARSE
jgi:arginine exporter protein ArgO